MKKTIKLGYEDALIKILNLYFPIFRKIGRLSILKNFYLKMLKNINYHLKKI